MRTLCLIRQWYRRARGVIPYTNNRNSHGSPRDETLKNRRDLPQIPFVVARVNNEEDGRYGAETEKPNHGRCEPIHDQALRVAECPAVIAPLAVDALRLSGWWPLRGERSIFHIRG
jgi:hypothetical protein